MKTIEKLQGECNQIRMKYEDLKKSKQDTLKEVFVILLKLLMIYQKNIQKIILRVLFILFFMLAKSDKSRTSR